MTTATTSQSPPKSRSPKDPFSKPELWTLGLLCAINFCHILDFMLLMPLGPMLMRSLAMDSQRFSHLVSAYSFSAAIFGIIAGFGLDKFDRKKSLLFVFSGLIVGTAFCYAAQSYITLMAGRIVAGAFGGITGATIFSIIGDAIKENKRGRAMGMLMTSFSAASVAGVPLGLMMANWGTWQTPFGILVVLGLVVLIATWKIMPPFNSHLQKPGEVKKANLLAVLMDKNHSFAFLLTFFTMGAGFYIIPFLSPLLVNVAQFPETKLPLVYLTGGLATLVSGPLIGGLSDRFGKFVVFNVVSILSIGPVLLISHLPPTLSVPLVLTCSGFFMVLISGRFIPSQALITSQVAPQNRGAFMSINSALTSMATGATAWLGGLLTHETGGTLVGIPHNGYAATAFILLSLGVVRFLKVRT